MSEELDRLFGIVSQPVYAAEEELIAQPKSLDELTSATAPGLKAYLESAALIQLPSITHATTPILWLIDSAGRIWFALEEVIHLETGEVVQTLPRSSLVKLPDVLRRLGHPALLPPGTAETKLARIGGEIIFDAELGTSTPWILSNNSGRYGKREHITPEHLANAQEAFAKWGISLDTYFRYSPTSNGDKK